MKVNVEAGVAAELGRGRTASVKGGMFDLSGLDLSEEEAKAILAQRGVSEATKKAKKKAKGD